MYLKFNLFDVLLLMVMLELPTVVRSEGEEADSTEFHHISNDVRCKLQPNAWDCFRNKTVVYRFYYDLTMKSCKTYQSGGCELNLNDFSSLEHCSSTCYTEGAHALSGETLKDLGRGVACSLQHDFGTCFNYYPMYYFDTATRSCKGFSYSGCGGNRNRFTNAHDCMDVCGSAVPLYKLERKRKTKF